MHPTFRFGTRRRILYLRGFSHRLITNKAAGSLSGDEERKAEGRTEQDKGTLKEKKGKVKDLLK